MRAAPIRGAKTLAGPFRIRECHPGEDTQPTGPAQSLRRAGRTPPAALSGHFVAIEQTSWNKPFARGVNLTREA